MWTVKELLVQARETRMTEAELARRLLVAMTGKQRGRFAEDLAIYLRGTLDGAPPDPESL